MFLDRVWSDNGGIGPARSNFSHQTSGCSDMAEVRIVRRTGSLIAGVVPPGGVPMPQRTLGIATWVASREELADPKLCQELLQVTKMRRELRAGRLSEAVEFAMLLEMPTQSDDLTPRRTVGLLRSLAASDRRASVEDPEDLLRASLELAGPPIPPVLLDHLLEPGCSLAPDVVVRVCLECDPSPETVARLRVLMVRRAARDALDIPSDEAWTELSRCVKLAVETPMHQKLLRWVTEVGKVAGLHRSREEKLKVWSSNESQGVPSERVSREQADETLRNLVEKLGQNLPLTNPRNAELHQALLDCFRCTNLAKSTQLRLARTSFSAWSTLRDAIGNTALAELVSFSAQVAALRQVFEVLLGGLVRRFCKARPGVCETDLMVGVSQGEVTLSIGRVYGLLFTLDSNDPLSKPMRDWFESDPHLGRLRADGRLQAGLAELLRVQLHALPQDEESARSGAVDVLDVVARVGFGAMDAASMPKPRGGLVNLLGQVFVE